MVIAFGDALFLTALQVLREIVYGTNYAIKIDDLIFSLSSNSLTGSAGERGERYWRSLVLFFENPLIGTLSYADIGKHSTFLDHLAQWGIFFGGILFYLISFLQWGGMRQSTRIKGEFGIAIGSLIAVMAVFGLNKHFASAGIFLFIIYPVIFWAIKQPKRSSMAIISAHA
jgi:hypothetical protein